MDPFVVVVSVLCLSFTTVLEAAPPVPQNLHGTPFIPQHGGPAHLHVMWDIESVEDISGVQYTVYYKEEGKTLQVENVIDVSTTTAQLTVVVGRTYVVWVTSVMQRVDSAPSNSLTLSVNYLQYATATYVPSGIEFECTFAQVSFDIGCMVFVQAENGQNVSKLFNVTSHGDNSMAPVAAGVVSGLERSLQYTYTVMAVRLSDGLKLQPNIILMGSVPPQISGLRRSSDTDGILVFIILLAVGVVLLPPILLMCIVVFHYKTKDPMKRKYGTYLTTLEELSAVIRPMDSESHRAHTVKVENGQSDQTREWLPLTDQPASRSGTLLSSMSGNHSRQMSGSDFLKALSLSDLETSKQNSLERIPHLGKKSRRLSLKRSFPFINISVSQDDDTDYTSTALYKSHSFDTALDAEFHQRLAEDNISLRTSLYNIIDDFDQRWNVDGINISDVSEEEV